MISIPRLLVFIGIHVLAWSAAAATEADHRKRLYTVIDSITLERPPPHINPGSRELISPDGRWAATILKRGNLASGRAEYSLVLFDLQDVRNFINTPSRAQLPEQQLIARFEIDTANVYVFDAITQPRWFPDSQRLAFLAHHHGTQDIHQLFVYDLKRRSLQQLTHHPYDVRQFALATEAPVALYCASAPPDWARRNRQGYVVEGHNLDHLLKADPATAWPELKCFTLNLTSGNVIRTDFDTVQAQPLPIFVSPSGRWALATGGAVRTVPTRWREYEPVKKYYSVDNASEQDEVFGPGAGMMLRQIQLIDMQSGAVHPLLDAPADFDQGDLSEQDIEWSADGRTVRLARSLLPLTGVDPKDWNRRSRITAPVEVELATGVVHEIPQFAPRALAETETLELLSVEDSNTPPNLAAHDPRTDAQRAITDLNPGLRQLALGHLEILEWRDRFNNSQIAGLLYPPNYRPGVRYPFVIQIQGFGAIFFDISPFTTGYAARALSGRGILVAQASCDSGDMETMIRYGEAGGRMRCLEDLIRLLDAKGLIDPTRVGMIGFSRMGMSVQYAATFSAHPYAAALITDSVQATPFNYVLNYGSRPGMLEWDNPERRPTLGAPSMIGAPFFGAENIKLWQQRSPAFNLDRIRTPLRYETHGIDMVGFWDTFAILKRQHRPIELVHIPKDGHDLETPFGRYTSQQGSVDWFAFWLKGEEDPDPSKSAQYRRWHKLRAQHLAHAAEELHQ